ncbi:MAG: ADP-glyceromanno-heptose 6-epimerase [Alphaproteobacteria bacterium]|nr:ADP-glyceromanno-heptose 6-epimerase [Alphaproteobacteria bacterium]MBP9878203.1 ADP-glyceromanno-heptose 6-epimerase [Alphaproteobacteria bacterium]
MIIITGASGFIGSNIFAAMLKKKAFEQVVLCDWLGHADKWKNVANHQFDDFVFPENLKEYLEENKENLKMIIHMGAVSDTTETDADYTLATNFHLSSQLWDFCADNEVRFIYASSAATYGDGSQGFNDLSIEGLRPLNPYGWSKHCFDQRVKKLTEYGIHHPKQWVGLKFFNVYGPNEYHKGGQRSVAHQLYEQIQKDGKVQLFKPDPALGAPRRDFIYVKDCVKVIEWFIDHPEESGIFNVGTGKARSFEDMAEACFKSLGKDPNIKHIDMPEHLVGKYQFHTEAAMGKLKKRGYAHKFYSLEEGIEDYYQNYLMTDNPYA